MGGTWAKFWGRAGGGFLKGTLLGGLQERPCCMKPFHRWRASWRPGSLRCPMSEEVKEKYAKNTFWCVPMWWRLQQGANASASFGLFENPKPLRLQRFSNCTSVLTF
eukprot:2144317-Amphidinium_carterae.1